MIKFTLYENAIDSINHGIEHFEIGHKNGSSRDFKQAILLMFQGTELLLKSLLSQVGVIYIFDKNSIFDRCVDPLNPTFDELHECRSIEVNKLCREIYKYYPNDFPKNSLNIVDKMAKIRNRVQHFGVAVERADVISMLGQLYFEVISVGLKLLGNIIGPEKNQALQEEIQNVFSFFENAENEERVLNFLGRDFRRGVCSNCGQYSLFILYGKTGYPEDAYCSSCELKLKNISIDEYRICPECGANSVLFNQEKGNGICLWYRCSTHRDGGIPIEMSPCELCNDFVIEGECSCGYTENED